MKTATADAFMVALRQVLLELGIDPDGDDVVDTPDRVLRSLSEMTRGYGADPRELLATTFAVQHADEMIVVTDVPFVSLCAHHLLPFAGTATIAYLPAAGARVVGLSKLPRLLDLYAARLQTQEAITVQVTAAIDLHLDTIGAACILTAEHGCMAHRGVRKAGARMVTSSLTGAFRDNPSARAELLALAHR